MFDHKYTCKVESKGAVEKKVTWTLDLQGKGKHAPLSRMYKFHAASLSRPDLCEKVKKEKNVKALKGWRCALRRSMIPGQSLPSSESPEEIPASNRRLDPAWEKRILAVAYAAAPRCPSTQPTWPLQQYHSCLALRNRSVQKCKGKKKEHSPQDAAMTIQRSFRDYMSRHSRAVHCLRDLAVTKSKLKEIRILISRFSYRHRLAKDAEERQRFSEKIIILLLRVDSIEV
ncbi:BAG family molecular chaperone regulator 7 [Platanthera guangdongensis]|uniref:BAG family molecular chaperone regulator 7 n=1 Tax=Platanthera guangdongensis TaxID=2320717 RepID=A0ABR2MYC3_9ASPA